MKWYYSVTYLGCVKCARLAFYIVSLFLFTACTSEYTKHPVILQAEQLVRENPDSARYLLRSIAQPEELGKADYAAWCLQNVYTDYMLDENATSDSLINIAIAYYSATNLHYYTGLAYYLKGYINMQNEHRAEAIAAYKSALSVLEQTDDNRLRGLCCQYIAVMYNNEALYEPALDYFQQSTKAFNLSGDSYGEAYTLLKIGELKRLLNYPEDSVISYFDNAAELAMDIKDTALYYSAIDTKAAALMNTKPEEAKNLMLQAYKSDTVVYQHNSIYLSYLYAMLDRADSASYFYKNAEADSMLRNDYWTHIAAAYVNRHSKNYESAFEHFEDAFNLSDSTHQANLKAELAHIEKKYDKSRQEKENAELKAEKRELFVLLLSITSILLALTVVLLLKLNTKRKKEIALIKQNKAVDEQNIVLKHQNEQRLQYRLAKLTERINNTLRFNRLNLGLLDNEKYQAFIDDLTQQSVINAEEKNFYIVEVNRLTQGRLSELQSKYTDLTETDLIVIALAYLGYDVSQTSQLLDTQVSTMYMRRKRIKLKAEIGKDSSIEQWIKTSLGKKPFVFEEDAIRE